MEALTKMARGALIPLCLPPVEIKRAGKKETYLPEQISLVI